MLTEDMKLWHGLVIAGVSLILQACLLAALSYLLSRHMAKDNERLLNTARLRVPRPISAHRHPPAAQEMKGTPAERSTPMSEPRYRDDSDASSDSSDTSESSIPSPPTCQTAKDVNYTQMVFPATRGQTNESAQDYENVKGAMDYVNIHLKSHKHSLGTFTFVSPVGSEPVEYTQVAM